MSNPEEIDTDKFYEIFHPAKRLDLDKAMEGFNPEQFTDEVGIPTVEAEKPVQRIKRIEPLKKKIKKLSIQK